MDTHRQRQPDEREHVAIVERAEPEPVSDIELGIAALLLILVVLLATIAVPLIG